METKFLNSVIHRKLVQETIYFLKHFAKPTLRNSIRRRTLDWLENPPTCWFFYVFKKEGVWQFSQKSRHKKRAKTNIQKFILKKPTQFNL